MLRSPNPTVRPIPPRPRQARPTAAVIVLVLVGFLPDSSPAFDSQRIGTLGQFEARGRPLLVDYYERFLGDRDTDAFRRDVASRYNEATLARLLKVGDLPTRRASVLALGLYGGYASNAAVARGLRDPDPTIRTLADRALWTIWFRADTPENNKTLERISDLVGDRRLDEAIDLADQLIARSPDFAEAYNQKAIAHFFQGRYAESVEDCKQVLERNPYHTGALSGMGQGLLQLGRRDEAIQTFRRALKIQPYHGSLRQTIAELESDDR